METYAVSVESDETDFENNETICIYVKYYNGGTVHKSQAKTISGENILKITKELCKAIRLIHELGIVHRDIHPSNIFLNLDPSGDYSGFLGDFGEAYDSRATQETTTETGHRNYYHPELILNISSPNNQNNFKLYEKQDYRGLGLSILDLIGSGIKVNAPRFLSREEIEHSLTNERSRVKDLDPVTLKNLADFLVLTTSHSLEEMNVSEIKNACDRI